MKNLIIDISNVLWANRFSKFKGAQESEFSTSLLMHCVMAQLISLNIKFKPAGILLAFDGRENWRKKLYPAYKATREKDVFYEEVNWVGKRLFDFFKNDTYVSAIKVDSAEADDVIYKATQMSESSMVISSDTDFVQLLSPSTQLYAQTLDVMRTSENPEYALFLKCIRGDSSDNILSAYPRIRETKLIEAWTDKNKMMDILETMREDGRKVGDVYEFNKTMIDLSRTPMEVQSAVEQQIKQNSITESALEFISPLPQIALIKSLGALLQPALAKTAGESDGFYNKRFIIA